MPEIKIPGENNITKSVSGSLIKNASSTINDITNLISAGEKLVSHVENIIGMLKGSAGAGSSNIIQSRGLPPPVTSIQEGPSTGNTNINDKSLENYFSSQEGLKKIADAIDKLTPLIGDLKLSEVKQAIMDNIGKENKKTKEK